ncbi:MAG: bifunctional DNA-formamidopyrimidine glycosylase/DNA-(apurinic or apyrimidinic site) lyase [Thermacetogeniaceae bacterium]
MPELPEVQTVLTTLKPRILGVRIEGVEVFLEKIIKSPGPKEFVALIKERSITGLARRGKYLLLELDASYLLAIHLRMTGQLVYSRSDKPRDRHTHLVFYLSDGAELRFQDMRQFGTMNLMLLGQLDLFCSQKGLGPDALDPALTRELFKQRIGDRRGQIKPLLLDQSLVAGIGNIYANEILWRARIHPERPVSSLTPGELAKLYQAMRQVLTEAVEHRGTTLRDYVDGDGNPGDFQSLLAVHGREGEPCPQCGQKIARMKTGGRSSFVCTRCQE